MDALVSPSRTIFIGDKQFILGGSFATLRAVQEAFNQDIVRLHYRIFDMRFDEVAKLISLGSGSAADEIGQSILDELGTMTAAYGALKAELFAWLSIAIAPKVDREKKSAEMAAMVEKVRSRIRGTTTSDSPSAHSDGSPASSGEATPGN